MVMTLSRSRRVKQVINSTMSMVVSPPWRVTAVFAPRIIIPQTPAGAHKAASPGRCFLAHSGGMPSGERPLRRGVKGSRRRLAATHKPRQLVALVEHGENRRGQPLTPRLSFFFLFPSEGPALSRVQLVATRAVQTFPKGRQNRKITTKSRFNFRDIQRID